MEGDARQVLVLLPKLESSGEAGVRRLLDEIGKPYPPPEEDVTDDDKEILGKRQAMAGAVLLRLGRSDKVWPLFQHQEDPRVRSYLLARLAPLGVDPRILTQQLEIETEVSRQRALILALGDFSDEVLPHSERAALIPRLTDLYRDHPDAGIHGVTSWLLRQWGQKEQLDKIDQLLATGKIEGDRKWYVNGQGQTLTIVNDSMDFMMGSPIAEQDREGGVEARLEFQHKRKVNRTIAMGTAEVSVADFARFRRDHEYHQLSAPTTDCPVNQVSWYLAAEYCNWLSQQEGIPREQWCYETNSEQKYASGMTLKANYLSLIGYRLPTEVEWEYCCRSGTKTARYFGETDELLSRYACTMKSRVGEPSLPVGSMRPNDLGLFDTLGNAIEWTQDRQADYKAASLDDREQKPRDVTNGQTRVLRGGMFTSHPSHLRAAKRLNSEVERRALSIGFRVARTFPTR
jgi:formylglycine-generating enzyme required for sulfatase activity